MEVEVQLKNREIRETAKKMRTEGKTLTEICEVLQKSKSTVHNWIKEIDYTPNKRTSKQTEAQIKATMAMQEKYKRLRDEAYNEFWNKKEELLKNNFLRDFINIYLTEGHRKNRNSVSVANSNPNIIKISYYFIKKFSKKNPFFTLQYHNDQDVSELIIFWSKLLNIKKEQIKIIRKSNSGNLEGRVWSSKHGVFTVGVSDTYLRSKIQALMDVVEEEWNTNFNFHSNKPDKNELFELISTKSFLQIGKEYGVSDNAVRKWCKSYDLPYRKKDIQEYKINNH